MLHSPRSSRAHRSIISARRGRERERDGAEHTRALICPSDTHLVAYARDSTLSPNVLSRQYPVAPWRKWGANALVIRSGEKGDARRCGHATLLARNFFALVPRSTAHANTSKQRNQMYIRTRLGYVEKILVVEGRWSKSINVVGTAIICWPFLLYIYIEM